MLADVGTNMVLESSAMAAAWLLTYLLHSTLLMATACLVSRLIRGLSAREWVWKAALIGGVLTATAQLVAGLEPWSGRLQLPDRTPRVMTLLAIGTAAGSQAGSQANNMASPTERELPRSARIGSPMDNQVTMASDARGDAEYHGTPAQTSPGAPLWPVVLCAVWVIGAFVGAVRLFRDRLRLSRQLGQRREIIASALQLQLLELCERAGVHRRIRLTTSNGTGTPIALGASEICLPEHALGALSFEEHASVLAHELAHLIRRDAWWSVIALLIERVLFIQPFNRLARREIQEAAEFLCDDWAVQHTGSGLPLARGLAEVATWLVPHPRYSHVSGMTGGSSFQRRVRRLLDERRALDGGVPWGGKTAILGALLIVPVAAPVVTAQPRSSDSASAQVEPTLKGIQSNRAAVAAAPVSEATPPQTDSERLPESKDGVQAQCPDIEMREAALEALVENQGTAAASLLRAVIARRDDCSLRLRHRALRLIPDVLESGSAVELLIETAQTDPDPESRELAVRTLGEIESTSAAEHLRALYRSLTTMDEKETVLRALGEMEAVGNGRWLLDLALAGNEPIELRERALHQAFETEDLLDNDFIAVYDRAADTDLKLALLSIYEDMESGAGLDKLLSIVRTESNPALRKRAISLLAESHDARAVELLTEIVTGSAVRRDR